MCQKPSSDLVQRSELALFDRTLVLVYNDLIFVVTTVIVSDIHAVIIIISVIYDIIIQKLGMMKFLTVTIMDSINIIITVVIVIQIL